MNKYVRSALIRMAEMQTIRMDRDMSDEESVEYSRLRNTVQGELMEVIHLAIAADMIRTDQLITYDEVRLLEDKMRAGEIESARLKGNAHGINCVSEGIVVTGCFVYPMANSRGLGYGDHGDPDDNSDGDDDIEFHQASAN